MLAFVTAFVCLSYAVAVVSGVVAAICGHLYGRTRYAERCRAMVVLAHDGDWERMWGVSTQHLEGALRNAPSTPFLPWRVWKFERDLAAWEKTHDWILDNLRARDSC